MATVAYPGTPGTVIYGGLPTPSGGTALTTITLANTSASPTPSEFFPRMFGLPLEQGDVPAGQYPQFALADETPCPASFGEPTYWPDGSMMFVPVLMRVPTSIAGSGSLTVTVKNGGSAPGASAVSPTTVTGASDLKLSMNALRNWTAGEWLSAVNQGIADGDVWTFANGPAGRVIRVYEGFRRAGADHGQAGMWHYVQVLQNSSGGLYGLRHLGKFHNGWHDVTSPQINTLVADAVSLKNGATTIRNIAPLAAIRSVTRMAPGLKTDTGNSLTTGMAVTFTTTGSLPGGLSTATTYYVRIVVASFVTLHLSSGDASTGANPVDISSSGSGTNTMMPSGASSRTVSWLTPLSAPDATGLVNGMAVRLSTTGTLPAGLSSNTAYFVRLIGGNGFTLHNSIGEVDYNSNPAPVTDAGTGTHTLTPAVQLEFYAAGPYTVGTSGDFDFIQAGGSGIECDVTVTVDRAYRKATKLFGPIDTTKTVTPPGNLSYNIDTFNLYYAQNGTGERPDIGYITGWCTRHFITGQGFSTVRTHAYQQSSRSWSLRRLATKAPLNVTDDTYSGLGAAMPSFRFYPGNIVANTGVNAPTDWGRMHGAFDWSHQPQIAAYTYMVTGEPHFLDMLQDLATSAVASISNKNPTISGTTYSAIVLRDEAQVRSEAWTLRDVAFAAMLTPATIYGAPLGTYFKNILSENFDYLKAEKLTASAFSQANGFYPSFSGQYAPWQLAYLLTAINLTYTVTQDPDAKTAAEDLLKNYNAIRVNKALFPVSNYYLSFQESAKTITAWDRLFFSNVFNTEPPNELRYDATTDTVTVVPTAGAGTPTNGYQVFITGFAPTGLSNFVPYYMRDVSGNTFKLAASPDGPALDIGASGTGSGDAWHGWMANASNVAMANNTGGQKSYVAMVVASARWAKALGFTIPSGYETAIEGVYGAGPTFTDDPVYALTASF